MSTADFQSHFRAKVEKSETARRALTATGASGGELVKVFVAAHPRVLEFISRQDLQARLDQFAGQLLTSVRHRTQEGFLR